MLGKETELSFKITKTENDSWTKKLFTSILKVQKSKYDIVTDPKFESSPKDSTRVISDPVIKSLS